MDELDPDKIVVDEQGVAKSVEPQKIIPAIETVVSLTELEQAREEAALRATELRRQGNAALTEAANLDAKVAAFDVKINTSKAKNSIQVDDLKI